MGESEEGEKVRRRVEEMKITARKAVQVGGSSSAALESFMQKLDHNVKCFRNSSKSTLQLF